MIRRVFTVVATVAFGLVLAVVFYSDDSRFTMWHVGIVLHQHNRMAVRFPHGSLWEFNEMLVYVPAVVCFLAAVIWNATVLHRKRSHPPSPVGEPAGAMTSRRQSRLSDWAFRCFYIFVVLMLIWLLIYALTWHK